MCCPILLRKTLYILVSRCDKDIIENDSKNKILGPVNKTTLLVGHNNNNNRIKSIILL